MGAHPWYLRLMTYAFMCYLSLLVYINNVNIIIRNLGGMLKHTSSFINIYKSNPLLYIFYDFDRALEFSLYPNKLSFNVY